jgi:xanthine dehydrogenase accessory factor
MNKLVLIKGAGDLASGIALRLHRCGFQIVMTDIAVPTTVRRTVAFSPAVYLGEAKVEEVTGVRCEGIKEVRQALRERKVAVVVDPQAKIREEFQPDVVVDAIIAKYNLGTKITDAPIVIGVGPGFTAGVDCHCVVETKRGHYLGRCIWQGSAIPNTGVPGNIGGYTTERIIRAVADGIFVGNVEIGAQVKAGDIVGFCKTENGNVPIPALIDGVVRGLLQDGVPVQKGLKSGDIDPRCAVEHCFTVSDKATSIGGGVLEAILMLTQENQVDTDSCNLR